MGRMAMEDVKRKHTNAGGHFFDPETMRFFRSRIESTHADNGYFVTSEQFVPYDGDPHPREYRVRFFHAEDPRDVESVGDWCESKSDAVRMIRALLSDAADA